MPSSYRVFQRASWVVWALFALAVFIPHVAIAQLEGGPTIGQPAPKVRTTDLDGRVVDLGDWIGKRPVFLEFWATWCESCAALKPTVDSVIARFSDRVEFIGIDVAFGETVPGVRAWLADHRPGFQVLYDSAATAIRAYDIQATSSVILIGADGKVAYTGVGGAQDLAGALTRMLDSDPSLHRSH
jgi:thiol-disulfide isomerase/thioredoxin